MAVDSDKLLLEIQHVLRGQDAILTFNKQLTESYRDVSRSQKDLADSQKKTTRAMEETAGAASRMDSRFEQLGSRFGRMVAAYVGLRQAFALTKSIFETGFQVETQEIAFERLMGSAQKAQQRMEFLFDFAKRTPFDLPQLIEASKLMQALDLDTEKYLETLGDVASFMGRDLKDAVLALGNLRRGEFESLKSFGVDAELIFRKANLNINSSTRRTSEENKRLMEALIDHWRERFGGGMEAMSKTAVGRISNIQDAWFRFQLAISRAGAGEVMQKEIRDWLDLFERIENSVTGERLIKAISDIISGLVRIGHEGVEGAIGLLEMAHALEVLEFAGKGLQTTATLLDDLGNPERWKQAAMNILNMSPGNIGRQAMAAASLVMRDFERQEEEKLAAFRSQAEKRMEEIQRIFRSGSMEFTGPVLRPPVLKLPEPDKEPPPLGPTPEEIAKQKALMAQQEEEYKRLIDSLTADWARGVQSRLELTEAEGRDRIQFLRDTVAREIGLQGEFNDEVVARRATLYSMLEGEAHRAEVREANRQRERREKELREEEEFQKRVRTLQAAGIPSEAGGPALQASDTMRKLQEQRIAEETALMQYSMGLWQSFYGDLVGVGATAFDQLTAEQIEALRKAEVAARISFGIQAGLMKGLATGMSAEWNKWARGKIEADRLLTSLAKAASREIAASALDALADEATAQAKINYAKALAAGAEALFTGNPAKALAAAKYTAAALAFTGAGGIASGLADSARTPGMEDSAFGGSAPFGALSPAGPGAQEARGLRVTEATRDITINIVSTVSFQGGPNFFGREAADELVQRMIPALQAAFDNRQIVVPGG